MLLSHFCTFSVFLGIFGRVGELELRGIVEVVDESASSPSVGVAVPVEGRGRAFCPRVTRRGHILF